MIYMKQLMAMRSREYGFTIIELLVTIVIIGVISSIAVISYNAVQARARDSERATDITLIMDALERYYRDNGEYPANDTLNPSAEYPQMSDFPPVLAVLPSLEEDDLVGPGDYRFFPGCINSSSCPNSSDDWKNYMTKSYLYLSRFASQSTGGYAYYNVPASYGGNTGWGCTIRTYYNDPGYMLAWYNEADKIWIFKRSQHGQVDINTYDTGPVAPQTCAFS
jgi:prepilin-type N-terminal cleavage/methylation domain-containing protein